ncbi:glycosyltransferase [Candidatus Pacearchaeota archaeon]|nr:glycosyltransferase [Candidatus Pacearchaeota archaeon]
MIMQRIAIIIPAYNEEKRIGPTLESYTSFFDSIEKKGELKYTLLVVVNNSKDKTIDIVKAFAKKNKHIQYLDLIRGGKGYATIEGFKKALKGDYDGIGFVDADSSTPPQAYLDLINALPGWDGVIASRWMKGSTVKTPQTFFRRILSRGFNILNRGILFLHFTDTQCGAKIFTPASLVKIIPHLGLTQWSFDIEVLFKLKQAGFKVREIPTIWEDQKNSRLNVLKVPFQMFTSIVRLRLLNSPFNFIVRAYDVMPEALKIHHRL